MFISHIFSAVLYYTGLITVVQSVVSYLQHYPKPTCIN